jgi:pyruvate ferredoxin oxidoreductase beta subunit/2-oxoisovalerate ferredoxin oxidoreductase beta subunit
VSQIVSKDRIPPGEFVAPGSFACPGCGGGLAMRLVLKALGPGTMIALPGGCGTLPAATGPQPAPGVPLVHVASGAAAATACEIRAALDLQGDRETTVLAWTGDGETFDTGLQALSRAAEANEDILYVCCDNEACRSICSQPSPATGPPRPHPKKDIFAILAAHQVPYAASCTVAHPVDLVEKVTRARDIRGFKFLHILAPCPPGWQVGEDETIDLARQAVRTRAFPLFEVENGRRWRFTTDHPGDPVEAYVRRQGRFRHLTAEQVRYIQVEVDARWETLKRRVEFGT